MKVMNNLNDFKKIVIKKYPDAILKRYNGKYYITDKSGNKIIPSEYFVNNSDSILQAWKNTAIAIQIKPIIDKNSYKFCDDKIYESYAKKNKDLCDID